MARKLSLREWKLTEEEYVSNIVSTKYKGFSDTNTFILRGHSPEEYLIPENPQIDLTKYIPLLPSNLNSH